MLNSKKAQATDYPTLLEIWIASVKETHQFLSIEDFEALKVEIPTYFAHVNLLAWSNDKEIIGFTGTVEDSLEMFFLNPAYRNQGYGSQILQDLIGQGVRQLAVNEQNQPALKFYEKNGFQVIKRSPLDEQGRPYPVLYMELKKGKPA